MGLLDLKPGAGTTNSWIYKFLVFLPPTVFAGASMYRATAPLYKNSLFVAGAGVGAIGLAIVQDRILWAPPPKEE